jgi:hypothetical protein
LSCNVNECKPLALGPEVLGHMWLLDDPPPRVPSDAEEADAITAAATALTSEVFEDVQTPRSAAAAAAVGAAAGAAGFGVSDAEEEREREKEQGERESRERDSQWEAGAYTRPLFSSS